MTSRVSSYFSPGGRISIREKRKRRKEIGTNSNYFAETIPTRKKLKGGRHYPRTAADDVIYPPPLRFLGKIVRNQKENTARNGVVEGEELNLNVINVGIEDWEKEFFD